MLARGCACEGESSKQVVRKPTGDGRFVLSKKPWNINAAPGGILTLGGLLGLDELHDEPLPLLLLGAPNARRIIYGELVQTNKPTVAETVITQQ